MNRRPSNHSRQFRALYVAAVAVALLGFFGAAFVPKAHAAPADGQMTTRTVQSNNSDLGAVGALFGTGCISLAGLILLAVPRH